MKVKKLLALSLTAALAVGMAVGVSAAELDTDWYAANNPDVVAELGNSPEALRQHYEMFGRKEGRMANTHDVEAKLRKLFNAEEYAALYPDVKDAFGEDVEAMFQHYISYGLLEARRPSEKVSYQAAVSLKEAIVDAMEKAGIDAVPGSDAVAAVIEGDMGIAAGNTAAVEALTQATAEVDKAVEAAAESTTSSASSGGSSSGSSSSSSSSSDDSAATTPVGPEEEECSVDHSTIDEKKTCAVCGKSGTKKHVHDWSDENGVCKWDYCQEECTEDHSNVDVGDKCPTCGLAGTKETHDRNSIHSLDDFSGDTCKETGCGYTKAEFQSACKKYGTNHAELDELLTCDNCEADGTKTHEHDWSAKDGTCASDGCNEECEKKSSNHGTMHLGVSCDICGYEGQTAHNYENGACDGCDATCTEETCPDAPHSSITTVGATCSKCGYVKKCENEDNHENIYEGKTCEDCGATGTRVCSNKAGHEEIYTTKTCQTCGVAGMKVCQVSHDSLYDTQECECGETGTKHCDTSHDSLGESDSCSDCGYPHKQ